MSIEARSIDGIFRRSVGYCSIASHIQKHDALADKPSAHKSIAVAAHSVTKHLLYLPINNQVGHDECTGQLLCHIRKSGERTN